jgi:hypothetical protein
VGRPCINILFVLRLGKWQNGFETIACKSASSPMLKGTASTEAALNPIGILIEEAVCENYS